MKFNLDIFRKAMTDMISTTDSTKEDFFGFSRKRRSNLREYSKEEIKDIIEKGTIAQQQRLSYNYFCLNGRYRRILIYYATLFKNSGILIPNILNNNKDLNNELIQKRYYKALDFIERIDVPSIATNIYLKALINGCYYGIIHTINQNNFAILDLPADYCYSRFKDINNNDIIEFNLEYFLNIKIKEDREKILETYPKEIERAYRKFEKGKGPKWFFIPSEIGICLPLYDSRPPFLNVIKTFLELEDYIELEKNRDTDEIKKILVQNIPHLNDGTFLFEPEEAEIMHEGAVGMLRNNPNISVLTTYGNVDIKNSQMTSETSKNNIEKIAKLIYDDIGVSSEIFDATGNLTLQKSIENDIAFMSYIVNKFSNFITNITNRLYSNSQIIFKYKILPITYYNESDYIDNAYKLATSGYSLLIPPLALDLNQKDLINIKDLENNVLKLKEKLLPLSTSFTESDASDKGAPEKKEEEKSDKTLQNEKSLNNN